MSIKISKISYFSFSFRLNEKMKKLLKIWFGEGVARNFSLGGRVGVIFNKGIENISEIGGGA